ncbi:hypothetical protein T4A_5696 [Trichinella pseudospiralis]|uniref:Uncharacterized protein n=1 Tax=Trichinella pseudospiralis TaxID=6337 RepID=A0A0V1EJC2_TRIPS|nr:hypothetical protein T4A_5696 [Trichinella pseudospiralis]
MLTKNFGWENFVVKVRNNFISCFNNAIITETILRRSQHCGIGQCESERERNLMLLLLLVFTVSAACSASVHPFQTNSGVDQFNQASAN